MFVYKSGGVPIKVWMSEQDYYSDEMVIQQLENLSRHPYAFHHVSLTPDGHGGYGMPIGGVVALDGAVCPNGVGVDIACGMIAYPLNVKKDIFNDELLMKIVNQIKRDIPMGMRHRDDYGDIFMDEANSLLESYKSSCEKNGVSCNSHMFETDVSKQLGTLGGGNHFQEIQVDENDNVWLMIHSGSRNIGSVIAKEYHKKAVELCKKWKTALPNDDLAILPVDTMEGRSYLEDMNFCVEFSFMNRICMLREILRVLSDNLDVDFDLNDSDVINIHHNYASLENHFGKNVWVHRKGATRVTPKVMGIIPGSMGSKSYIVVGSEKNQDSFNSCSHGAGRTMSRKKAKETFDIDEFQDAMKGIVSVDVNNSHLDESPMAYKDISKVMENQKDLIRVVHELSPMANIKG